MTDKKDADINALLREIEQEEKKSVPADTEEVPVSEDPVTPAFSREEKVSSFQLNLDLGGDEPQPVKKDASSEDMAEKKTSAPTVAPKKKKLSKKAAHHKKMLIYTAIVVVLSVALAVLIVVGGIDMTGLSKSKDLVTVTVSRGSTTADVAKTLKKAGVIDQPLLFRFFTRINHADGTFQFGSFSVSSNMGYAGIVKELQDSSKATVKVTIPEGQTLDQIAARLAEAGVCTKEDFYMAAKNLDAYDDIWFVKKIPTDKVYYPLEGYLYPDTYKFFFYKSSECAELAIHTMLKNTADKWSDDMLVKARKMGYSMHEIMAMASVVQLESSSDTAEMNNVAAVFYNRLSWNEPHYLGSSPTANYPYGNGAYNTNVNGGHEGLPVGPICSPGIEAIKAALYPSEGFKSTYFLTDSDMRFYYFDSYTAFINKKNALIRAGKWA